jgi:NAD(P)-dependent dehydrogenase (short-subunit alcohol dehydrogenase family)
MAVEIDLSGRVALVTGGTKGVGRGIAQRFADAGATVAVCARHEPEAPLPDGWHYVGADLRDPDQAAAAVDAVVDRLGRIDVAVNNAGGSPPADSATVSARFTERIIALNLLAALYVAQRANHYMQQDEGGAIVNITSVTGVRPAPTVLAYGAAKAGLINATMTMGMEWAPKVRVNSICVGLVQTELAHLHYQDDAGIARVAATVPNGRLARPTEVGDVAVWLASPLASYVTGANIFAHGGGEPPAYLSAVNG